MAGKVVSFEQTAVTFDFVEDWRIHLLAELAALGINLDPASTVDDVGFQYFNAQKRRISRKPREVHLPRDFTCPREHDDVCRALLAKMRAGDDVTPHLSNSVREAYDDLLLNDWGIYHFHLGEQQPGKESVDRTGALLFARVTKSDVFVAGVFGHNFVNRELIEVLHRNWPESFESHVLRGLDPGFVPTSDQIKNLRKKRVNVLLELPDGRTYAPPGGGYSTSGLSTEVVRVHDWQLSKVQAVEDAVAANLPAIVRAVLQGAGPPAAMRLELDVAEDELLVRDRDSGRRLRLVANVESQP